MARKKVTPEEEIVNTAVEGTALGSVPADTAPPDETGADTGDVPAELPEGDLSAEETAEQSETLSAMEAAETKPLGLSTEEKTASQDESDTAEERVEEAELHEEMSEIPDAEENLLSDLLLFRRLLRLMKRTGALGNRSRKKPLQNLRRMNTWQMVTLKCLMHRRKRASARFSTNWTSTNWTGG